VLFGLTSEAYLGEAAPEALAVTDEFVMELGSGEDYLESEIQKYANSGYKHLGVVKIEIDFDRVREVLTPATPVIPGEIVVNPPKKEE